MNIIKDSNFLSVIKGRYILVDTSVFIDAISNPKMFAELFNEMKDHDSILVTLECVLTEFIKGSFNEERLKIKGEYIKSIVDSFIPLNNKLAEQATELAKLYKDDGKGVSVTDFLLGATTMQYPKMLLMTSNSTDFPNSVFTLETYFLLIYRKAIEICGFYSFSGRN